ncbi:Zn-dependent peptidase ImmA (M78 family)/DNA-binding XRE family transcriptional regulator [Oxalobacteraceae bacterium GrIS 2.11]
MINQISQKLIGLRVRAAREAANYSQDQLASALNINDRQTISDIEKGKRAVKAEELFTISELLNKDTDFFIDPFSVAGEAKFSWRADPALDESHLNEFENRAGRWIGLLRWLREMKSKKNGDSSPLKNSLRLSSKSTFELAQTRAEQLVNELELGVVPAEELASIVEKKLDIPVLFVDSVVDESGKSISGATCHLDDLTVILINRNETEVRRNYDLAHELFHALTWDLMEPDHRESNSFEIRATNRRTEQLADNFAAALLMPSASLERLIDPKRSNSIEHLVEVAAALHVSPVALGWRLVNLKKIDKAICQQLTGISSQLASTEMPRQFSFEFIVLLQEAIDKGWISPRKAAKIIVGDLDDLSKIFIQYGLKVPFDL